MAAAVSIYLNIEVTKFGTTAVVVPTMLYTATCGADSHPHHISVIDTVADSGVCVLPSPTSRTWSSSTRSFQCRTIVHLYNTCSEQLLSLSVPGIHLYNTCSITGMFHNLCLY